MFFAVYRRYVGFFVFEGGQVNVDLYGVCGERELLVFIVYIGNNCNFFENYRKFGQIWDNE